jgi:hypothetical protein
MTVLFRRINPAQKFRITKRQIAKFSEFPNHSFSKSNPGSTFYLSTAEIKEGNSSAIARWNSGKMPLPVSCKNAQQRTARTPVECNKFDHTKHKNNTSLPSSHFWKNPVEMSRSYP